MPVIQNIFKTLCCVRSNSVLHLAITCMKSASTSQLTKSSQLKHHHSIITASSRSGTPCCNSSLTVDINVNTDMHPLILIIYMCMAAMLLLNIDNTIIQTLHHCIRYGMSGSLGTQIFINPSGCFRSLSKMVPLRVCRRIKMQQQQQQTIYMSAMYCTKSSRTGCRTKRAVI